MRPQDNPFAMDRLECLLTFRPDWSGTSWDKILPIASSPGPPLAVTGHHGSGKTTFLDALHQHLTARDIPVHRIFFNADNPSISPTLHALPPDLSRYTVLIDGDSHLGICKRHTLLKALSAARRRIHTRHLWSRFPTLLRLTASPITLHNCVRLACPEHYPELAPILDSWFSREKGNIRNVLRHCYDFCGHY